MITKDKITEIYCIIDEFSKKFDSEAEKNLKISSNDGGRHHRKRPCRMSKSEIMPILVYFHFGTFSNFKHYYLFFIRQHIADCFPDALSYNRFVELMPRVFIKMLIFMRLCSFGRCSGITFVDSTMIPVCDNLRRYANMVFAGVATDGKGTMGWCHGFKLHYLCNDRGNVLTFCLTGANVDDRGGYISKGLFEDMFDRGIHIVHGLKANMKNKLMPMWDKIMLRKRYVIECINHLLKDKANLVHSRRRSLHNFIINFCSTLMAYSFFDNKPQALQVKIT